MIDIVNGQFLTMQERRDSLFRALHTQPFYNLLTFPVLGAASKDHQWEDKGDVNKNFYLTEAIGNFDEAFRTTSSLFNLSIYATLNQGSIYNYMQTINLPSGFITTEARSATVLFANQLFDDRQFEYCPYLIKAGDRIISRIVNTGTKTDPLDINLLLKGYYVMPNRYLNENSTRGINESLSRQIRFELWHQVINHTKLKTYSFKNDRTARMILGFGIIDHSGGEVDGEQATIELLDTFRNLKWTSKPIPIEYLAPRVGDTSRGVRDTRLYYLPVEYLWEPFSSLQAMINNIALNDVTEWELVMLTRTV